MKYIIGNDRNQSDFLALEDRVQKDNIVRVVDFFVDGLDLKKLGFVYSIPNGKGRKSFNPSDMLKLYIYGYIRGIRTCRKLEYATTDSMSFRWLLNNLTPHYKTISNFRKDNIGKIAEVFDIFMRFCIKESLVNVEKVAVDGSFFEASNHNSKSYSEGSLKACIKKYNKEIASYLAQLEIEDDIAKESETNPDREEDNNTGVSDILPKDNPEEHEFVKERIKKIKVAKRKLRSLKAKGRTQESLTDKDCGRMSKRNSANDMCYNVQIAADSKYKLILAGYACSEGNDKHQLSVMGSLLIEKYNKTGFSLIADKGYDNGEEIKKCNELGIKTFVQLQNNDRNAGTPFASSYFKHDKEKDCVMCPMGKELQLRSVRKDGSREYGHKRTCAGCKYLQICALGEKKIYRTITINQNKDYIDKQAEINAKNPETLAERKEMVEHPFGTMKVSMNQRNFWTRGLKSVNNELQYTLLAYNIKRVFNIMGFDRIIASMRAFFRGDLEKIVIFVQKILILLTFYPFYFTIEEKSA